MVNKTNSKDMMVSVTFEKNNVSYTIQRGRKPQLFKFFANNIEQNADANEAQGENRETQKEINKLLGMTHAMFKNIIALNTYTQPFLATKQAEQREIIEQLLGITLLSEKADLLKEQMKSNKTEVQEEKFRIDAITSSNEKIEQSIDSLQIRSNAWKSQNHENVEKLKTAIEDLEKVDIEKELTAHKQVVKHNENQTALRSLQKEKAYHEDSLTKANLQVEKTKKDLKYAEQQKCPTCEQQLNNEKHQKLHDNLSLTLTEGKKDVARLQSDLAKIQQGLNFRNIL